MAQNLIRISVSIHLSLFTFLLIGTNVLNVHTIEPESLWIAINATIQSEKVDKLCHKTQCAKIILYNQEVVRYVKPNYTGNGYLTIDINNSNPPDGFMSDELTEQVKNTINNSTRFTHCILVISMVNTTKEAQQMGTEDEAWMETRKIGYSLALTKMLQFKTPVNQRILILVRYGESQEDFGQCRKKMMPYLKYPRRLVPIWEQVLFDHFAYAKAVHAVTGEKTVQTRKEEGHFVWMCDDIIEKIEAEEVCKKMEIMTPECKEKMANGTFSAVGFDMETCKSWKPRM